MDAYLTKPVMLEALGKTLEQWVSQDVAAKESAVTRDIAFAPGSSAVDLSVLMAMIGDDEEEVARMLEVFRSGSRELRRELNQSANHGDGAGAIGAAHRFKSNAYAIGATVLGDWCARIEQAGKVPDNAALVALVQSMDEEASRVDACLASWLAARVPVNTP